MLMDWRDYMLLAAIVWAVTALACTVIYGGIHATQFHQLELCQKKVECLETGKSYRIAGGRAMCAEKEAK